MAVERKTSFGTLRVHDEVVATIVEDAALHTEGIVKMGSRGVREDLSEWLNKEERGHGVTVTADDEAMALDIYVGVRYGVQLNAVGAALVDRINRALEQALGFRPNRITVHVEEVVPLD